MWSRHLANHDAYEGGITLTDDTYEAPAVEDQTSVTEPLNTIAASDRIGPTPAWRTSGDE